MSDAYCKKHYISYCPDLSKDCPYCRIAQLEAQKKNIQCVRDDLRERLDAVKGLPTKAEEEAAGGSDYWKGWVDACRWIRQAALGGDDET